MQYFSEIYTCIFHHKTFLTFPLQATSSSLKKKGKKKANMIVLLVSIKILEAELSHLPLNFNTAYKPDPFHYCDSFKCSILLPTDIKTLSCDHTYHNFCYSNNGFKCLFCLSFIQDGVDEHVQSLLQSLQKRKEQVVEPENNIPCDDNDDESEPIKYVAYALEEALCKFQQQ